MSLTCPFCHGTRHVLVAGYPTAQIRSWYQRELACDVASYFQGLEQIELFRCIACDLRFFAPMIEGGGAFYDDLGNQQARQYPQDKTEFRYIIDKLIELKPEGVLDIGCGNGHFLRRIQTAFEVAGAEQSQKAMPISRNWASPSTPRNGNMGLSRCSRSSNMSPTPADFSILPSARSNPAATCSSACRNRNRP
jgi:SAM-dependent methyltransferase